MKKSISLVLIMMLLASLFTIVPASASTEDVIYEHIDISSVATGKFWVDKNSTEEKTKTKYSQTGYTDRHYDTDFFIDSDGWEVVAQWPASFNSANGTYTMTGTLSDADKTNPIITSKSGVTYKMPTKTSTFTDGKESINFIKNTSVEVPINGNYDKINLLTASGCLGTAASPVKTMTVKVKYAGEEAVATKITNEPVLGRSAHNTVDNFVGVLSTLGAPNNTASFGTSNGTSKLGLYEYSIDVDEEKVVESISISMTLTNSSKLSTLGIPAITGLKTPPAKVYAYKQIDISSVATGKFWVDINSTEEKTKANYSQTGSTDRHFDTDFFLDDSTWEVVAQWPASFNNANGTYKATGTLSAADTTNPIITSKAGVVYKMPTKTSDFIDGKESINFIRNTFVEVPINGNFDKINFLTASGCNGTTEKPKKTMTVKVKYAGEEAVASEITSKPVLGRTAHNTVDNFVGVLSTYGAASSGYTSFGTANGTSKLALYEYSIDVDEAKVVESIIISMTLTDPNVASTLGIPAITGLATLSELPAHARSFTNIDLTSYANGKFYVNHLTEEANYSYANTDLLIGDRDGYKSSVTWPFALHTRTTNAPEQAAIITSNSTSTPKITSLKSGVPYQMPTKRDGLSNKEAVIFNAYGAGIGDNWGTIYTKTINVSGNYSALHFLIGRAGYLDSVHTVYVEAHYTDGTIEKLGTGELVNGSSKRPTGVTVPGSSTAQQTKHSENFVADLVSGFRQSFNNQPPYAPSNSSNAGSETRVALYEYTLALNPSKTLKKIDFYQGLLNPADTKKIASMALVSLTMESVEFDNLTNGFSVSQATVSEGSCSATVAAHCEGKAILAVYSGSRLVGLNFGDVTEETPYVKITVEAEEISEENEYTVKAMLWTDAEGLSPIANAAVAE